MDYCLATDTNLLFYLLFIESVLLNPIGNLQLSVKDIFSFLMTKSSKFRCSLRDREIMETGVQVARPRENKT